MFGIALMALVAVVGWLVFWTAVFPEKWQAKNAEGIIAPIAAGAALSSTSFLCHEIVPALTGYIFTIGLCYITVRGIKARRGRRYKRLQDARLHY